MEKNSIFPPNKRVGRPMYQLRILIVFSLFTILFINSRLFAHIPYFTADHHAPHHTSSIISHCKSLNIQAGPSEEFSKRSKSDRYVSGTKPVLIKRAKIWTGRKNGTRVIRGDILLDKGLIKSIGNLNFDDIEAYGSNLLVVDANNSWVTPGIVDVHSHLGDAPSPILDGAKDVDSLEGTVQPWLRSLDGLNTHDDSYLLSVAGGVTTSLILPGSANAIGGQAFIIKLRQTSERSPSSMLLEPPHHINNSFPNPNLPPRWRHLKHACGETPGSAYKHTRMDTNWAFREAYKKASQIKEQQDEYCARALAGKWRGLGEFPYDLQWEALVDVLRGRVKVNVHCYEAVDLDNLVRLSNEFKFPIAAFHHASEAYLVPDLIKKAYGKTPAIALFATASRYKREAYRSSEFAPLVLARHGLKIVMKSDHPLQNSRHLLYEAQQAHYYGLPENLAIASVTSNSAEVMGMGHRIGYIDQGWDADLVIWDSHPLALGATPTQVFIDGIPQLDSPRVVKKPETYQRSPRVPKFGKEADEAVKYEGLPPLAPKKLVAETTVFTNVKSIFQRTTGLVQQAFSAQDASAFGVVIVQNGTVVCSGARVSCLVPTTYEQSDTVFIDLKGGSIAPGLVSFGAPLGLQHIDQEPSTTDGNIFDPLIGPVPKVLGGDTAIIRAADGLLYGSRDALLAYRVGVTKGITAPSHSGFYAGLGVSFSLGAAHKLEEGAIIQEVTAVHVSVRHFSKPSVSTQIAALRRLLLGPSRGSVGNWFQKVKEGSIPLVVEAHSADIIATLIILKREVEIETRRLMKMTITGGAEAYLLAQELADDGVGVILNPVRPFPYVWEDRRILPGPPLTKNSAIMELISHGVTVGIGCEHIWQSRNLPFDVAWAAIEAGGRISKEEAIAIGSVNVEKLLGAEVEDQIVDLVATQGGELLETGSKVVAVISPARQLVHVME